MTQSESDPAPSRKELESTHKELCDYRDRLAADVLAMGRKLKLPRSMVEQNIAQHDELESVGRRAAAVGGTDPDHDRVGPVLSALRLLAAMTFCHE